MFYTQTALALRTALENPVLRKEAGMKKKTVAYIWGLAFLVFPFDSFRQWQLFRAKGQRTFLAFNGLWSRMEEEEADDDDDDVDDEDNLIKSQSIPRIFAVPLPYKFPCWLTLKFYLFIIC